MPIWRRAGIVILAAVLQIISGGTGNAQEATLPLRTAPTVTPAPPPVDLVKRGIAQFQAGNYEEAYDDLSKAQTTGPRTATTAYYLGLTLKKMQSYDKALESLKEATVLQPAVKEAFLELADVYYALQRYDEALASLDVSDRAGVAPAQSAFLRGLTLAKKRKSGEALAQFDLAAQLDPGLRSAVDFQKAGLLQREGKTAEAKALYVSVAEREPTTDTGTAAKEQMEALEKSQKPASRFRINAGFQVQYDSNVILKPDNFALSSASTATGEISDTSDLSAIATVQAIYGAPVAPPWGLRMQYALYAKKYQDLSQFDVQSHTLAVTPSRQLGENSMSLGINYNYTLVDGEKYLSALAASPQYSFVPTEGQQAVLSARYQKKDFLQEPVTSDEDRDSTEIAVGFSWNRSIDQQRGYVNARYELNSEDAAGKNWSYTGHRLSFSMLKPLGEAWKAVLGIDAYRQAFKDVNTVFLQKRDDTTTSATAQVLHDLTPQVSLQLSYGYTKGDSSIAVYAYTKNTVTAGVNARF